MKKISSEEINAQVFLMNNRNWFCENCDGLSEKWLNKKTYSKIKNEERESENDSKK